MNNHNTHSWEILRGAIDGKHLICHPCGTVTTINDLLFNTETEATKKAEIKLLSKQLFAGDLKKKAHDEAYVYVRSVNPDAISNKEQEKLL